MTLRRTKCAILSVLSVLFASSAIAPAIASNLSPGILGMFPAGVSEFAYADASGSRQYAWFAQVELQVLPGAFAEFEQFLAAEKIDSSSTVDSFVWALVPIVDRPASYAETEGKGEKTSASAGHFLGVVIGQFSPDAAEMILNSNGVPSVKVGSETLYACGGTDRADTLFFVFIDANTVAVGERRMLERLLRVRAGSDPSLLSQDDMMASIRQANGQGAFWAVLGSQQAHGTLQQLVPEAANFPQSAELLHGVKALSITVKRPPGVDGGSSMEATFQAQTASVRDALTLSQLLQAGLLFRRYQAGRDNPELAQMLDGMTVSSSGEDLNIDLSLTNEEAIGLIEHNTFAGGM